MIDSTGWLTSVHLQSLRSAPRQQGWQGRPLCQEPWPHLRHLGNRRGQSRSIQHYKVKKRGVRPGVTTDPDSNHSKFYNLPLA